MAWSSKAQTTRHQLVDIVVVLAEQNISAAVFWRIWRKSKSRWRFAV